MVSLSNLPDELIILIAEACDVPDKARLARLSRRLNDLATEVLMRYSVQEEGNSAMYWAAEHGHINTLERMLSCGAEINDNSGSRLSVVVRRLDSFPRQRLYTSAGFFPLHIAAKFGQEAIVEWLLTKGARIESLGQHVCQCQPNLDVAEEIEDFDDFEDFEDIDTNRSLLLHSWTPLHVAICSGHISTTRLLLSRGASIRSPGGGPLLSTFRNVFHTAARHNNIAAMELLVDSGLVGVDEPDNMGYVALHYACSSSDNLPALKKLIHLGASLDISGQRRRRTPLGLACEKGFFDGAILLLEKGANLDISIPEMAAILLRHASRPYLSFPHPASSPDPAIWEQCREDFIRRLVELGVDIDELTANTPSTPLAAAAADYRSRVRTLRFLLDLGADVNAIDYMGRNPIFLLLDGRRSNASYTTTANKVDLLLRYGARPDLRASHGSCAFDMALRTSEQTGDDSIMAFIFQHGLVASYGHKYLHEKITRSYESHCFDDCRILARRGAVLKLSNAKLMDGVCHSIYQRNLKQIDLLLDLFPGRTKPWHFLEMAIEFYNSPAEVERSIIKSLLARPEFVSPGSSVASRLIQLACRRHSPVYIVQLLLEKGGQVNEFDSWLETPLSCAVARGCRPMVRLLLLHGADPHLAPSEQDWSAYVCKALHSSDAQYFDFRDTRYPTSFMRAIREFHCHEQTHSSYEPKAKEALPSPLELILEHRPLPPIPQDPRALSYVHFALGWPEALRVLLAKGADPNSGDHCVRPPLLYFLSIADRLRPARPETLSILLEFGADIHRTDDRGRSFLTMMKASTLATANGATGSELEAEELGFEADLLLKNFFITRDENFGEECVKPRPGAIAEAKYPVYPDRLAVCKNGNHG